jgi:hypothetical protein
MTPTVIQGRKITRILPPTNSWNAINRPAVASTSHLVEPVVAQHHIATLSASKTEEPPLNPGVGIRKERPEGERGQKRRRSSTRLVQTQLEERREPPPILPPLRSLLTRTRQQGLSLPGKSKAQKVRGAKSSKISTPKTSAKENKPAASRSLSVPRTEVQVVIFVNPRNEQQSLVEPGQTKGWSPKRLRSSKTGASGGSTPLATINNVDVSSNVDNDAASHITVSIDENDTRAEGEEYEVENIHGEKIAPGTHEFLIEWVGYVKLDWIAAEDCFCADKIAEFRTRQRKRLLEATQAGRKAEANMLRELADAERIRSERIVIPEPKPLRISSFRKDPKTGRFIGTKSRDIGLEPRALEDNIHQDESGQDAVDDEQEQEPPRDARANTARLTSKAPTVAYQSHVPSHAATGEIIWIQSQVCRQEGQLSSQNLLQLGRTQSRDNITAWIAGNTALEAALEEAEVKRRMADNLAEEVRRQQEKVAEDQRILASLNKKKEEIEARDLERKKMEREKLEREELARREAEIEEAQQREASRVMGQPEARARSTTVVRDEMLEERRMRERMWKQKLEQAFASVSATKQGVSFGPSDHPISSIEAFEDPSSSGHNGKAEQLRAARNQEARTHQAGAIPTLVRSEFRTALSHRQAEALINQTRASPERSLGFPIPDNTLRATVET